MIDVSQWRASIGLWNYCQAASSRPANGCHSHSFKAAIDSKSGSTTSEEKTSKLPAALSLIAFLLFFHSLSLLRHILMIPLTSNCYQVQCTTGVTVTGTNYLQSVVLPGGSSSNLSYNDLYVIVCLRMLLLLSGDVERNPGPMIDDQPDIFLLLQWLEPLADWQSFGLLLPGITQQDITTIEQIDTEHQQRVLFSKWLNTNPTATWRDVLNALTERKEINLLQTINDQLQVHPCTGGTNDTPNSSTPVVSTVSLSVSVIDKPVTSTTSGNPQDIARTHSVKLTDAITTNLYRVTDALYAEGLIPLDTKEYVQTATGISDYRKSSQLVSVIQQQLQSSLNPEQYLSDMCHILVNQQHHTLTDIATSILHELGQSIPDSVTSISSIPDDVQGYADNIKQHYKHQPIVATDWPPRIGKDFFGRLALVEKQDSSTQTESAWHLLRGQVDKILKLPGNKEISIEGVLQPTDSSLSLRVVIDGPPGIGKTTLCRKLLNMWSNGTLVHQQYDLVLYCPLRDSKIATATTLADLFLWQRYEVPMVMEWLKKGNGKGLLIIYDGWDELSEQLRKSSLATNIIYRKQLDQCSVIVTSRSYASSSLLKIDTLSRHVQVIGFSEEEISTVIIQTLQKDTKLAKELIDKKNEDDAKQENFTTTQSSEDSQLAVKLINDLKLRNDVQSLCYIPLVCSMVILVYCKEGGHLPTTLTQLYENFILQTIRRHVEIKPKHNIDPYDIDSPSSLPSQLAKPLQEMCQLAYTSLANTTMTFSSHELQSLSEAVKEDYLGLITTFIEYDKKKYQFIHLSIQEFLAAWWIAKHEKKTEEVFKNHFDDDHFRMCLRTTDEILYHLVQLSSLYNIQECYCELGCLGQYVPCLVLLQFLSLPQMKILHLLMDEPTIPTVDHAYYTEKCTELEKCIEVTALKEIKIDYKRVNEAISTIISVIRGVTRNKTITSLTLNVFSPRPPLFPLPDGAIEQLLNDNNTLQALSLDIPDELLPSSLNIVEVNTPLTALHVRTTKVTPMSLLFPHIRGLHCLILTEPYPPHLLFDSHPGLQTLTLTLDTAESAIELFTILQTNTTLKALRLKIKEERVYTSNTVTTSSSTGDSK
uniref:NACHT domain-containing protein n=1 Tax=Amphimedon queenslandica TaxID=400682 RepID=A0A1X7UAD9_AMPQE